MLHAGRYKNFVMLDVILFECHSRVYFLQLATSWKQRLSEHLLSSSCGTVYTSNDLRISTCNDGLEFTRAHRAISVP